MHPDLLDLTGAEALQNQGGRCDLQRQMIHRLHLPVGLPHRQIAEQGIAAENRQDAADDAILPGGKDPLDGLGVFGKITGHIVGDLPGENDLPLLQGKVPCRGHRVAGALGIVDELPARPQ